MGRNFTCPIQQQLKTAQTKKPNTPTTKTWDENIQCNPSHKERKTKIAPSRDSLRNNLWVQILDFLAEAIALVFNGLVSKRADYHKSFIRSIGG